jgi:hypothetical protein
MNTPRRSPTAAFASPASGAPSVSRQDRLSLDLLGTIDLLRVRRDDLVSDGFIADYVALHWLEWNDGALRLTATGTDMCDQMRARLA